MEEYEARFPGVPISLWAPHKRRSKKSGWAVGGKGFVDYFICSPAGAETTSRAKAVPEYYVARHVLEQKCNCPSRRENNRQHRPGETTTGKIRIVCDAVPGCFPCCSLVAVASTAELRSPPNVMSQSNRGERMAG